MLGKKKGLIHCHHLLTYCVTSNKLVNFLYEFIFLNCKIISTVRVVK